MANLARMRHRLSHGMRHRMTERTIMYHMGLRKWANMVVRMGEFSMIRKRSMRSWR